MWIIGLLAFFSACNPPVKQSAPISDLPCARNFTFSKDTKHNFDDWEYQNIPGTNLATCLYPDSSWVSKDNARVPNGTGVASMFMYPIERNFWLSANKSYPHLSMIIGKVQGNATGTLADWVESNYSFSEEAKKKPKLSETCAAEGFSPPHFITFDIGPEKLQRSDNGEFAKFRACKTGHIWYAIRIDKEIYLMEQEGFFKLEGPNEELLLNIIRSTRPLD